MLPDPTGYGRIVRNARGAIQKIVEQKDASKAQLKIREGNSGIMAVPAKLLKQWLGKLKNANAQGEYYLTDIIAMAVKDKVKVTPLIASTVAEVLGVNDKAQLAELEAMHRAERARELMEAGATLVDPARIDIRAEITVGRDVFIDANVLFEGKVTLGDRVRVGPNVVLRDVSIGADSVIHPNSVLESSEIGAACLIGRHQTRRRRARRQFCRAEENHHRGWQQGQSPHVSRRRHHRQGCQRGCRHHHLQLRRCEQIHDDDRGWRVHRLGQHAGGAGAYRQGCDHGRGQHHHQGSAGRQAHAGAREADDPRGLEAPGEETQVAGETVGGG
jgi:bifunctional UDP-N-acetylglucosamine pyrophosphorylase/glucosamine-1-phosphate N-acetyltransferase